MEPQTEIVSDAPVRRRRKAAKKATATGAEESAVTGLGAVVDVTLPSVVLVPAGEPVVQRLSDQAQPEQGGFGAEEIRELMVERLPLNPRLVLASYEESGVKQLVKVFVGVNRNFRPRMMLSA